MINKLYENAKQSQSGSKLQGTDLEESITQLDLHEEIKQLKHKCTQLEHEKNLSELKNTRKDSQIKHLSGKNKKLIYENNEMETKFEKIKNQE